MSSALGKVKFKDGTIKFFRYNGTCDWCDPCLFDSQDELNKFWRNEPEYVNGDYEWNDVVIAYDYGRGYWFNGKATKSGWIHPDSLEIYPLTDDDSLLKNEVDGLPDWFYDGDEGED